LSRNAAFRLSAILLNEGRLTDELRKCGLEVKVIPEAENGFIGIVREAGLFLRARQVGILHSHRYKENLLAALLARRCRIPVVVRTEHGAPEPFQGLKAVKQAVLRQADRLVARYATDSIISVSAELERFLARYTRAERITSILNGLDLSAVRSRLSPAEAKRRLNIPAGSPVLGYAGRLAPVKRLDIFVAAASEIRARIPETRFVIAGGGSDEDRLRQTVRTARLEDGFVFLGRRDDIYDVLRAFDVFLLCSDHEGLPIVLLEALYLGVPVVARRVGGIPEVIQHAINGLLVDSVSPPALAQASIQLLEDSELRRRLATAGTWRVATHFSAERTAAQTAALYLKLLRPKTTGQCLVV
jgi:L-malate glycosyltransferase